MMIVKYGKSKWLWQRFVRLGVPLVASVLILGPFEMVVPRMLYSDMSFSSAIADSIADLGYSTLRHRWFLVILLMYCSTAVLIKELMVRNIWENWAPKLPKILVAGVLVGILVLAPFLSIAAGKIAGEWMVESVAMKVISDQYVSYLPFFLGGLVGSYIFKSFDPMTRVNAWDFLGIAVCVLYLVSYFAFYRPDECFVSCTVGPVPRIVSIGAGSLAGYFAIKFFYLFMRTKMNKPSKTITYFVEGSFCIYLVHSVFYLTFGSIFTKIRWNADLEFLIITGLTLVCSIAAFEIVRRSKFLSYCFNGAPINLPLTATR